MNAANVLPYGSFVHEVAQAGGVDQYKAAQKALLDAVKDNSFQKGVSAGKKQMMPWLVTVGVVSVCAIAREGYCAIKRRADRKKQAQIKREKDAEEAEKKLMETPLDEELVREIEQELGARD